MRMPPNWAIREACAQKLEAGSANAGPIRYERCTHSTLLHSQYPETWERWHGDRPCLLLGPCHLRGRGYREFAD